MTTTRAPAATAGWVAASQSRVTSPIIVVPLGVVSSVTTSAPSS